MLIMFQLEAVKGLFDTLYSDDIRVGGDLRLNTVLSSLFQRGYSKGKSLLVVFIK